MPNSCGDMDATTSEEQQNNSSNNDNSNNNNLEEEEGSTAAQKQQHQGKEIVYVAKSVEEAMRGLQDSHLKMEVEHIFVVGGTRVFEESMLLRSSSSVFGCDRIFLTLIKGTYPCTCYFPPIPQSTFEMDFVSPLYVNKDGIEFLFVCLKRTKRLRATTAAMDVKRREVVLQQGEEEGGEQGEQGREGEQGAEGEQPGGTNNSTTTRRRRRTHDVGRSDENTTTLVEGVTWQQLFVDAARNKNYGDAECDLVREEGEVLLHRLFGWK
eukprot:GHVS01106451.1.p2 GENE.GHVS01106451.1~~GHVS01106451.1.p2  ORF type:complete len:267 (+),score=88.54 GHVS01106451.1:861-1661(+)